MKRLDDRARIALRGALTKATYKFTSGGREREQHKPRPVTLAKPEAKAQSHPNRRGG
jgi:hypothetical protein